MRLKLFSRPLILVAALMLLSACSNLSKTEKPTGLGNEKLWQAHQQQISQLDSWQITGKIAIRNNQQSGSGALSWLQEQKHFDIQVSGPLGQGNLRLSGLPNQVQLTTNTHKVTSNSAEHLMQQLLGWSVPLDHLLWWVRGLPAPKIKHQVMLNDDSLAYQIQQANWKLDYLSYQTTKTGARLPQRIKAYGPGLELTLFIKQWQD